MILDPRSLVTRVGVDIDPNEPLMWTRATLLAERTAAMVARDVLVPAELVYFPFLAKDYETRAVYPLSSNGLASGATYLELSTTRCSK